ncbi:hypothetical protein B0H11DRAFT_2135202 [Mycena galericulata]|nr:hypothetical protein B0H11DRAFT_2135202 [Mycena galericulata]
MPLHTSTDPLPTMTERVAQKAAANPELARVFEEGLEGVYHYKLLKQPTLDLHDSVIVKWRTYTEFSIHDDLPEEIELGAEFPSEGICKEFITFLAAGVKGTVSSSQNATRRSVKQYMSTWFAVWRRRANAVIPVPLRNQLWAYLDSMDLKQVAPLTRDIRAKPIGKALDLDHITRYALNDRALFRTNRARAQFTLVNVLSAQTGERPGAIVESHCYEDTNEALLWGDVSIWVVPNPIEPRNPHIAIIPLFRLPKGHRDEQQYYKSFILLREPLGLRAQCPVTLFLYLALHGQVLGDSITDVEQIVRPDIPPTKAHILTIKDEFKSCPVFLAEELNEDGVYVTSETKALKASVVHDFLKKITLAMGYIIALTLYCWRRGAAGNFNRELGAEERRAMMTHGPDSDMFRDSYQSRQHEHDLGAILNEREPNQENIAVIKAVSGASAGRDADAPTTLSFEGRAAMLREPELVAMRENIAQIKDDVSTLVTKLASLDLDSEDPDMLEERASLVGETWEKRRARWRLQAKYHAIVAREENIRFKIERRDFYKTVSRQQLEGKPAPSAPAMVHARVPLADKTLTPHVPFEHRFVTSTGKSTPGATNFLKQIEQVDPIAQLCDVLYHSAEPDIGLETVAAVTAYLGLPERPFAPCYPGESPTAKNKCPVCGHDCDPKSFSGTVTVGSHIHTCLVQAQQESAQAYVEASFKPQHCQWEGCKHKDKMFETRTDFVKHFRTHIVSFSRPPTAKYPERVCRYLLDNGEMCGDVEADHYQHFGQVHGINIREKVEVHYCVTCPEWHIDELGDGLHWEGHCWDHFYELYEKFATRVDGEVDLTPIGVEFTAAIDNCVDFKPGTGFAGAHPEFHGLSARGVASIPMQCPWCVFNDFLHITQRMEQFLTPWTFQKHLQLHDGLIEDNDENLCPVPHCGTHKFSRFDLMTHIVAFHRLPLCGATNHTTVRRLRLPVLVTAAPLPTVDLAHLHNDDDEMDVDPAPVKSVAVTKGKQTERQILQANIKKARKAQAAVAVVGYCHGCKARYLDVGKHITSSERCRAKNAYEEYVDNRRDGLRRSWPLEDAPKAGGGRAKNATHFCHTCRRQFVDIRTHKDDPACNPTEFSIRIPGPGRKWGPKLLISSWIIEQDAAAAADKGEGSSKRGPSEGSDNEDREEGSSTGPRTKKPKTVPAQHPPADANFVCCGCDARFGDVEALRLHFTGLRQNSKCRAKQFRERLPNSTVGRRFGPTITWDAWLDNPQLLVMDQGE